MSKITIKLLLVPALYLLSSAGMAENLTTYKEPDQRNNLECTKNMLTLSECSATQRDSSKKYLTTLIGKISEKLSEDQRIDFENQNNAWEQYQKASCKYYTSGWGGNSAVWGYVSCEHAHNKARIELLFKYLNCLNEGGQCHIADFIVGGE